MDLIFANEGKFIKNSRGDIYSVNGGFTNVLWERYLSVFYNIRVMARVAYDSGFVGESCWLANSDRVSFIELPTYTGPKEFLNKRQQIKNVIKSNITCDCVYLCRLPGTIGNELIKVLNSRRIPYGCEVVGDPWDVFAPGGVKHLLRSFIRVYSRYKLYKAIGNSCCTLYVTQHMLQCRYPTKSNTFVANVSNVQLFDEQIAKKPKILFQRDSYNLISVGSLAQLYKSPDIVIKAIAELKNSGVVCCLRWLGDGKFRSQMEVLARDLGVGDQIDFLGNVAAAEVVEYLRLSDIFILVSRTEGLPRAVIEAMAQGLPCIGSNVGGIPELLDADTLVKKDNVDVLVEKIKQMVADLDFTNYQAERNLAESSKYKESLLNKSRVEFYNELIKSSK